VDITFIRRKRSNVQNGRKKTLMIGQWKTDEKKQQDPKRVSNDCNPSTPMKSNISGQERCDSTPSTMPASITSTKIQFDSRGRPENVEVYHVPDDDCSVSTMGDSVFDDAKPGTSRKITAKPLIILSGTF
jgi:hypothetical protein